MVTTRCDKMSEFVVQCCLALHPDARCASRGRSMLRPNTVMLAWAAGQRPALIAWISGIGKGRERQQQSEVS